MNKNPTDFYRTALLILKEHNINFLIGGAWALKFHIGIQRDTKDLDIFCYYKDLAIILNLFEEQGYKTDIIDMRWLAKVYSGDRFIDFIFNSRNELIAVDESWFMHSKTGELLDVPIQYVSVEEIFINKIYILNRDRYDGADLNHIILRKGNELNWKWILEKLDHHWLLLLSQILNFQFVYPSERDKVPEWLYNELILRANGQYNFPISKAKLCRGSLIEHSEYSIDTIEWGFIH